MRSTEAFFSPSVIGVVKGLVRAGRSGTLALLPLTEAHVLLHLAAGGGVGVARARAAAAAAAAAARGSAPAPAALVPKRYGELFEALLRVAGVLSVGLYRRSAAVAGLRATAHTAAAVASAAGAPGGGAFANNRALISYVFTNPPADTLLGPHDMVYVLRAAGGEDEEIGDAMVWGAAESRREGALAEAEAEEA